MGKTEHDLPHAEKLRIPLPDFQGLGFGNSFDLRQSLGLFFHHLKSLLPKGLHNPAGRGGTDPFDHAGGEVFEDGLAGGRTKLLALLRVKLTAVDLMILPSALDPEDIPFVHHGQSADHRDQLPAAFQAKDGVAVLLVAKGDHFYRAFDELGFLHRPSLLPVNIYA